MGQLGGDQAVTEVLLPVGAGVVAVPRACLGPVILVGRWPCRAPLELLSAPLALLRTRGAGGVLAAAWYVCSGVLAPGFIKSSNKEARII